MNDPELLKELADKVIKTGGEKVIYELCKEGQHLELVKFLLDKGIRFDTSVFSPETNDTETPLNAASRMGHTDIVKLLLDLGAYIDRESPSKGFTSLFFASQYGHTDVVQLLLERGADADKAETEFGQTPLNAASYCGHIDVVKLLLKHGVDVHDCDNDGATPLFSACQEGHIDVAKLLLENGADPDAADKVNFTPLMEAVRSSDDELALEFSKLLLSFGANPVVVADNDAGAVDIARWNHKTDTEAWLDYVRHFTPIQICVVLNLPDQLRWLLRRRVYDIFALDTRPTFRKVGPKLAELAVENKPMLKLCHEIRLGWDPCRHHLFHPAFRSTVKLLFLIRSCAPNRGLAGLWIKEIPTEIWIAIASQMKRVSWPKLGRNTLTY